MCGKSLIPSAPSTMSPCRRSWPEAASLAWLLCSKPCSPDALYPALCSPSDSLIIASRSASINVLQWSSSAERRFPDRYKATSDATKAMQQLDNMDIAGNQIAVTIAPLSQAEAAAAAAAAASALDLDDAEGVLYWPQSPCKAGPSCMLSRGPSLLQGVDVEAWSKGNMDGEGACACHAGEHGGLKLTANARAALMQRLSGQAAPANGLPLMGNGLSWSCLPCCDATWSFSPAAICTGRQILSDSNLTVQDCDIGSIADSA